ncbi:MAG: glycosyltransferase family 4 protein [Pseudomonadota bacterium]
MKILFFITEDWFFCSHFLERAAAARAAGFEVSVLTQVNTGSHANLIISKNIKLIPLKINRHGLNAFRELQTLWAVWRVYRSEKPNIAHHIALKPIIYGTIAAKLTQTNAIVNAPVGMGYVFTSRGWLARFLKPIIYGTFRRLLNPPRSKVIFENPDDRAIWIKAAGINNADAVLIRGAGVNTTTFYPVSEPPGTVCIVLAARMLWDKGVGEFVEAARLLTQAGIKGRFILVGTPDPGNPASISESILQEWHGQNGVEWWGRHEDMPAVLRAAHIACLPSYREGLPKSLLEAAACGLPIVTTDAPGCREIVHDGDNGFLVPVRDAHALASALQGLIDNPVLRAAMGLRSREMVLAHFSREQIISETLAVYRELTQ